MTSGGNGFNDFPEIVPTRAITPYIEKIFPVLSSVAVGLFLECAYNTAASMAPTLVRHWKRLVHCGAAVQGTGTFRLLVLGK